ncbi:MAG: hypothetical protein MK212_02135 [Saprospiraceae bacterium]|nr:hypothetical protein [Saprospiraceae bacterium]
MCYIRKLLMFGCLCLQLAALANMGSPVRKGTLGSDPFISQYVTIEHEDLYITVDSSFTTTQYKVRYYINATKSGKQIPFLFYASEFLSDFSVQIDSQSVPILPVPKEFEQAKGSKFENFAYFFETDSVRQRDRVLLKEKDQGVVGMNIGLNDMLYFETNIDSGQHIIEVNYTASQWKDYSGWVINKSFRYALSPALYWKSFGTLTIHLDATACKLKLSNNLGMPTKGDHQKKATWNFDKMPVKILQITHKPSINSFAQFLIQLGPFGIGGVIGGILMILHILLILRKKRGGDLDKVKIIRMMGNLLVPFIYIGSCFYAYDFIYWVIGPNSSGQHSYHFIMWGMYPILLPFYWLVVGVIESILTKS